MNIGRKNIFVLFILAAMVLMGCGYKSLQTSSKSTNETNSASQTNQTNENTEQTSESNATEVIITAGGKEFNAVFYKNETTDALLKKLPVTINMKDLNSNEKYYYFDEAFPNNSEKVGSIKAGDIMLYGDSCVVLFYESFNTSYSYTKIGYIEKAQDLESALSTSAVDVTFNVKDEANL